MDSWKHPDIQTKNRIHKCFSRIFLSRLYSWSKVLADPCYLVFSMTDHGKTGLRVTDHNPQWKDPKLCGRRFYKKFHQVFRFLPARSLDMTCPLTSDRQFPLRPCCLNKGMLTEASVTEYQRFDLQCWECVFRTNREAQSGTVGSFHSKSLVFWAAWHSRCVCGNVKEKFSQN